MPRPQHVCFAVIGLIAVALAFPASATAQGKPGGPKTPPIPGGPGLIAYCTHELYDPNPRSVMLMNPDGTGRRVVTTYRESGYPAWSYPFADGTLWLGWTDADAAGNWGVAVIKTHTGLPASPALVPAFDAPAHLAMPDVVPAGWRTESPDWSPPGPEEIVADRRIQRVRVTFHMGGRDDLGRFRVWIAVVGLVYDLDAQSFALDETSLPLVLSTESPDIDYFTPRFSPDGAQLAFNRQDYVAGSPYDSIWVVDLDRPGIPRLLIDGPGTLDDGPAWSQDGRYLAFRSNRSGRLEAWILDLETLVASPAPPDRKASEALPSWSPDGQQIAYMDNSRGFAISKIAGGAHYKLTIDGTSFWPDWSPVNLPPLP
jgi:dipeptidyl aminopeptidase/acylaminoacyl peptidase